MDEPFSALDEQNRTLLQEELLRIWDEDKKTVVFITHSVDEAVTLGDRIVVMTAHPGRIKTMVEVPFPRPRERLGTAQGPGLWRAGVPHLERIARRGRSRPAAGNRGAADERRRAPATG